MLVVGHQLVWIEPPGSVTMEFPDIAALVQAARAHGAKVAFDTTWAAGLAFNAFELGADIAVHALTKYPSGGGDLLMGAVTTRDEALHLDLKFTHMRMGWGVGANDAEAVLRALPSLPLRYEAADRAARALAQWLARGPRSRRCCILPFRVRRVTTIGGATARRRPGSSRSSLMNATRPNRPMRSSMRCASSRSAIHGPARSASRCRTGSR